MTRVGAVVNDIRKKVSQSAPELSKRCRSLIKCWQKLAEPKPTSSGSSSTNGTPSCASPLIRKGLTPGSQGPRSVPGSNTRLTPAGNSRLTPLSSSVLTPSGSSGSRSAAASPTVSNGRTVTPYQRSGQEIPTNTAESGFIRKSHVVGTDLAIKAVESSLSGEEIIRNGKRKGEYAASPDIGITNGLSAVKRLHCSSASVSPATPHQSLLAARRADVKSTSELVAQLTENLPGYLAINISQNQDPSKNECNDNEEQANVQHFSCISCCSSLYRTKSVLNLITASTSTVGNAEPVLSHSILNSSASTSKVVIPTRNGKYDWYAMLPSLDTLRNREHFRSKPSNDQRKSYIMNVLGRKILALPYVDVGLPDFLEYQFPKSERFYAEENFMYGAPRPN
ncbi:unnamed protein product [Litomosoides sigmodontis]|uniref:TFIIS N-terminal domain-containing protein n=1 Tax=Litomosoides sigmodontis TaxID=42156 RepID=A0A3P6TVX3_LITSI|nr:unnamed protein product [Litomosoides sigmodontis]